MLGLGVLVAAPLLLSVVGAVVRPVVRRAVQSGIAAYDAATALVTTAGEEFAQPVADARATATAVPVADLTPAPDIAPQSMRPAGASA